MPQPLPDWIPQAAQKYIRAYPSYGEGDVQAPVQYGSIYSAIAPELQPMNPQIGDIQNQFADTIRQNRGEPPPQMYTRFTGDMLRKLIEAGGFLGGAQGT
jgi:hypothetical protein